MMSNKGDAEAMLVCPYNNSHHILKHRMQQHLVKCCRDYPDVRVVTCPFNATHRIPEPELKFHLSTCDSRLTIDKFCYRADNIEDSKKSFPMPKLDVQPGEYWDDKEDVSTYHPEEHCLKNPVIRSVAITKSSAQRRNFRIEERVRYQQFENTTAPISNKNDSNAEELQQQRRPVAKSAAIANGHNSVSNLMQELKHGAGVLTIPKIPSLSSQEEASSELALDNEEEYPSLQNHLCFDEPKSAAPWGAKKLAMSGIALNRATKQSFGRGTALAKKN